MNDIPYEVWNIVMKNKNLSKQQLKMKICEETGMRCKDVKKILKKLKGELNG